MTTPAEAQAMVVKIDAAITTALTSGWATLDMDGMGSGERLSLEDLRKLRRDFTAIANGPQEGYPLFSHQVLLRPQRDS